MCVHARVCDCVCVHACICVIVRACGRVCMLVARCMSLVNMQKGVAGMGAGVGSEVAQC